MALSVKDIKTAYPLPAYNYRVEIAGESVSFSEVSGLTVKLDTTTYKESPAGGSGVGPSVMHMPAQLSPATISLKKGLIRTKSVAALYKWIASATINQVEKKDVYVRLCDEEGKAVISWKAVNAFPTQLDAPSFSASSNDAAIESMTLMADRILVEET